MFSPYLRYMNKISYIVRDIEGNSRNILAENSRQGPKNKHNPVAKHIQAALVEMKRTKAKFLILLHQ
jgi:hypothetical protein